MNAISQLQRAFSSSISSHKVALALSAVVPLAVQGQVAGAPLQERDNYAPPSLRQCMEVEYADVLAAPGSSLKQFFEQDLLKLDGDCKIAHSEVLDHPRGVSLMNASPLPTRSLPGATCMRTLSVSRRSPPSKGDLTRRYIRFSSFSSEVKDK